MPNHAQLLNPFTSKRLQATVEMKEADNQPWTSLL